jgi:hypothetical protein
VNADIADNERRIATALAFYADISVAGVDGAAAR